MHHVTLGRFFAAASLCGWLVLLLGKTSTPWPELDARRPHMTGSGMDMSMNTAWGTPFFGKEFGGCYREGRFANTFLIANLPGYMAGVASYAFLQLIPIPIRALSFLAGTVALAGSALQWWALGSAVAFIYRRVRSHAVAT
jgi:hypothetical protein